jgi:hypothetical protein
MTARIILGAALGLTLSTGAFAQSFTAPAGIPAVTAPGGLEGRAALPNIVADQGRSVRAVGPYGVIDEDGLTTGAIGRSGYGTYRHVR